MLLVGCVSKRFGGRLNFVGRARGHWVSRRFACRRNPDLGRVALRAERGPGLNFGSAFVAVIVHSENVNRARGVVQGCGGLPAAETSGPEGPIIFGRLSARLKPCPFKLAQIVEPIEIAAPFGTRSRLRAENLNRLFVVPAAGADVDEREFRTVPAWLYGDNPLQVLLADL